MGCDIHSVIERRGDDGKWLCVTPFEQEDEDDYTSPIYREQPLHTRNYALFSLLADVRNYGGDAIVPLSQPRGVPPDASKKYRGYVDHYGVDGHSHSFFLLKQLLAHDYTQIRKRRGYVNGPEFFGWDGYWRKEGHPPRASCADVGGGNTVKVTEDEMRALVDKLREQHKDHNDLRRAVEVTLYRTYCEVEWERTHLQMSDELWARCIPLLLHEANAHGLMHNEVRVCFFFDN